MRQAQRRTPAARRQCDPRSVQVPHEPPAWFTSRLNDLMAMRTPEGFRPPKWSKDVDQLVWLVIEELPPQ